MKNTPHTRARRTVARRRRTVAGAGRRSRRLLAGLGLMVMGVRAGAVEIPQTPVDRTGVVAQDTASDIADTDEPDDGGLSKLPPAVPQRAPSFRDRLELGLASFYHQSFHGRRTASGHALDAAAMTAAHRTLPLGTRIRITNLANGRVAHAVVTDRGPFAPGRVVDVTQGLARALGFLRSGLARVSVEVTGWEALPRRTRPAPKTP